MGSPRVTDWYVNVAILNSIRLGIGSQWSCDRRDVAGLGIVFAREANSCVCLACKLAWPGKHSCYGACFACEHDTLKHDTLSERTVKVASERQGSIRTPFFISTSTLRLVSTFLPNDVHLSPPHETTDHVLSYRWKNLPFTNLTHAYTNNVMLWHDQRLIGLKTGN